MAPPSPVRDQVRLLFSTPGRHVWSIDELQQVVSASLGGADYSSVFRAVAGMEREGLVDKVDLGDGKAHFELREDHHEHIRCDSCGRVVGVPGCILENATSAVESDTGFTITSHQLLFSGLLGERCQLSISRRPSGIRARGGPGYPGPCGTGKVWRWAGPSGEP